MNKKFLDKVLDQIVSETRIDYDRKVIVTPLPGPPLFFPLSFPPLSPLIFTKHCRGVYGLNDDEVKYVWDEYKKIILNKTNGDNSFWNGR